MALQTNIKHRTRSHNTLDEADIIAREIKERRILVPHGGIPHLVDELILVNGDRLLIDFVDLLKMTKVSTYGSRMIFSRSIHRVRTLTSNG